MPKASSTLTHTKILNIKVNDKEQLISDGNGLSLRARLVTTQSKNEFRSKWESSHITLKEYLEAQNKEKT